MLGLAAASGVWMASKPTFQGHRWSSKRWFTSHSNTWCGC